MIDPTLTHEQLLAEEDRLNAAYEATRVHMKESAEAFAKFDAVQIELAELRKFYRSLGELVDRGHDKARAGYAAPKVTNNDGSAA